VSVWRKEKVRRSFAVRLTVAIALIDVLVLALAGISLQRSRRQFEERATVAAMNLAALLESSVSFTFDKVNVALLATVKEAEQQLAAGPIQEEALRAFLLGPLAGCPELRSLFFVDATGKARASTLPPGTAMPNLADRDYFTRLREDPSLGMVISKPLISRWSGAWALGIARRVNRPDGSFAGVVVAGMELTVLERLFSSLAIGPNGAISLRDGEFAVILRVPEPAGLGSAVGHKILTTQAIEALRASPERGFFYSMTSFDGIGRQAAYRKASHWPLYLFVGLASSDYLAPWRQEVAVQVWLVGLFLLISTALAWGLERSQRILRQSEARLRAIWDTEPECVTLVSPDGLLLDVNPAGLAMLELDEPGKAIGKPFVEIVAPAHREQFLEISRRTFQEGSASGVFEIVGQRGTRRWMEAHAVTLPKRERGQPVLLAVTRDVTDRKRLEAERDAQLAALTKALAEVRQLEEFLPICAYCKRIRDDQDYWQQVEKYIGDHTGSKFSHGICPECLARHFADPV
jgi:PAS domain S-box-containing protein